MPKRPSGWRRQNGSSTSRGYDYSWQKLRERRLATEPLCRFCAKQGRVTAANHVDHLEPFAGLDDPLRLDFDNTRSLCEPCHMGRTQAQAVGSEYRIKGSASDGAPLDPDHPWNRRG